MDEERYFYEMWYYEMWLREFLEEVKNKDDDETEILNITEENENEGENDENIWHIKRVLYFNGTDRGSGK